MTVAEIIILIIGAILFTASFFIPDRGGDFRSQDVDKEAARKAAKDAVSEEMKKIKVTIEEATEESISDNKDKMERYMDRLTNEKMMAVNEYSDTVLEQIHKDHQEAVFLYDMIDSKYNQVKSTAAEINQLEKSVRKLSEEVPKDIYTDRVAAPTVKEAPKPAIKPVPTKTENAAPVKREAPKSKPVPKKVEVTTELKKADYTVNFEPLDAVEVKTVEVKAVEEEAVEEKTVEEKVVESTQTEVKQAEEVAKTEAVPETLPAAEEAPVGGVELMFDSDSNSMNNNDRILSLHKEGKSNMAIAKELGLGVGEVKLVIDLFKSI